MDQIGISNYATFGCNPIINVDVLGDKKFHYNAVKDANGSTILQLASVETVFKNVVVGYVNTPHSTWGRSPIYESIEDTKDQYIVATKSSVYTDNGTGNRRINYTTESTYDSYNEAYANRDNTNDLKGPLLVGLASVAHAHRLGEAPGAVRKYSPYDFGKYGSKFSDHEADIRNPEFHYQVQQS